jgi:hypothetical protein
MVYQLTVMRANKEPNGKKKQSTFLAPMDIS